MVILRNILNYFNILSLDVVLGAMAGMLFFSDLLDVDIPGSAYFLLGMAVWSTYTWDHLMDSRSVLGKNQSLRHQFHRKYFRFLLPLVFSCILIGCLFLFFFAELKFLLTQGIVLGAVIVVWMGVLKIAGTKVFRLKEISTALVYVLGISLAPFFSLDFNLVGQNFYIFAFIYFLATLVNILMLSFPDEVEDQKDGFGSALVPVPKAGLKNIILLLAMTGIGILAVLAVILPSFYHIHSVILGLILGYHLIFFFSKNQTKDQVRRKSEALFLLPFLLLLF